jgi:uncharacterized glyoxalase superfamily protein PhnB
VRTNPARTMLRRAIPLLHVSDSSAANKFYCGQLGFRLASSYQPDPQKSDPAYLSIVRDDAALHLSSFSGDGVAGGVASLIVDDVDALYREYTATGIVIDLPPTDQTWGNREMYVKDADGNCLRFQQLRA